MADVDRSIPFIEAHHHLWELDRFPYAWLRRPGQPGPQRVHRRVQDAPPGLGPRPPVPRVPWPERDQERPRRRRQQRPRPGRRDGLARYRGGQVRDAERDRGLHGPRGRRRRGRARPAPRGVEPRPRCPDPLSPGRPRHGGVPTGVRGARATEPVLRAERVARSAPLRDATWRRRIPMSRSSSATRAIRFSAIPSTSTSGARRCRRSPRRPTSR